MSGDEAAAASGDRLRTAILTAAQQFNGGHYFEAHEYLEENLDDVPDDLWPLFLGLIQIAVGYHKISQGLLPGASAMLTKALAKVEGFPADAGGIRLEALRQRARDDLDALRAGRFDHERFAQAPPRLQPLPIC